MEKYIKKMGYSSIIVSTLLIILSLFMMIRPMDTMTGLMVVFGYLLIISSLIHFISYFSIRSDYRFFSYELAQSIIYFVFGFFIIVNSTAISETLPIFLGIWVCLEAIFRIQIAFNLTGVRNVNWGIMVILSCIEILIGICLIYSPIKSINVTIVISGAILAITQLINIFDDFYIMGQVSSAKKIIKKIDDEDSEIIIEEGDYKSKSSKKKSK